VQISRTRAHELQASAYADDFDFQLSLRGFVRLNARHVQGEILVSSRVESIKIYQMLTFIDQPVFF